MEGARPTVLIVDDDQGLMRLVIKALEREGIAAASAGTATEAADILKQTSPELLLLDLKLPDAEGHRAVELLAGGGKPRPFIIMTGQGDERVAVEMMKLGALDYLVKDRDFIELLAPRVGRALDQLAKDRKIAEAEEALRREHAFTSALIQTSAALVVVLDSLGRIVRFNPACERTSE